MPDLFDLPGRWRTSPVTQEELDDCCGGSSSGKTAHTPPSITCPRCGLTSYHPKDIAEGYCGRCHDWTQQDGAR
jgi:ribosomal protein L37E